MDCIILSSKNLVLPLFFEKGWPFKSLTCSLLPSRQCLLSNAYPVGSAQWLGLLTWSGWLATCLVNPIKCKRWLYCEVHLVNPCTITKVLHFKARRSVYSTSHSAPLFKARTLSLSALSGSSTVEWFKF